MPVCPPILPVPLIYLVGSAGTEAEADGIAGIVGGGTSVNECLGRTDPSFGGEGA